MFNFQAYSQNFVYAESIDRLIEYFDSLQVRITWDSPYKLTSEQRKRKKREIKWYNERRNFWTTAMPEHEKDLIFSSDTIFLRYHSNTTHIFIYTSDICTYSELYYNEFNYRHFPKDEDEELIYNWDKELFSKIRDPLIVRPRRKDPHVNDVYMYRIIRRENNLFEYDFEYFTWDFEWQFFEYNLTNYINRYFK
mgnify:CR=1 FL=1